MAKLTAQEKRLIVSLYAIFCDTGKVLEALGRDVPRRTVEAYNAGVPGNRKRLSEKWLQLFDSARAEYLQNVSSIGVSHIAHRLRLIDGITRRALSRHDDATALSAIRSAREELPPATKHELELSYDFIEMQAEYDPEHNPGPESFAGANE